MADNDLRDQIALALAEKFTSPKRGRATEETGWEEPILDTPADRLEHGMYLVFTADDGDLSIRGVEPLEAADVVIAVVEPELRNCAPGGSLTMDKAPGGADSDVVLRVRRDLMKAAMHWSDVSDKHEVTRTVAAIHHGARMATVYAYTLAALLGQMAATEDADGQWSAEDAAQFVQELLVNGDFDDLNADVTPDPEKTDAGSGATQ